MRSRGLVVAIAVVLAVLAAVGVIVYTNSVKNGTGAEHDRGDRVQSGHPGEHAAQPVDRLGGVRSRERAERHARRRGGHGRERAARPNDVLHDLANEQIPTSRLATGTSNTLGISDGHVGLGIQIDGPQSVNGYIRTTTRSWSTPRSRRGTTVTKQDLKHLLAPAQLQRFLTALKTGDTATLANTPVITMPFDFTLPLIKSVRVLAIQNPPVDSSTGKPGNGGSTLVLDMLPADAQALVLANTDATQLWLGLLPPNKDGSAATGYKSPATFGVPFAKVTGVGAP